MALFPRKKKENTRKQYRVRVHQDIQVRPKFGDHFPDAELMDVTARGAGLLVPNEDVELYGIGKLVDLTFTVAGRGQPVRARARIQHIDEIETQFGVGAKVGVEFLDLPALYEQIEGKLWTFFNRRQAYRITQPPKKYTVRLRHKSGTIEGWLYDLSVRGFAMAVDRETRLLVLPGHHARAQFQIPDSTREAPFEAKLIHRMAEPATIRLGFAIDPVKTPMFTRTEESIREHVMERQRQELQKDD